MLYKNRLTVTTTATETRSSIKTSVIFTGQNVVLEKTMY